MYRQKSKTKMFGWKKGVKRRLRYMKKGGRDLKAYEVRG